MDCLDTLSKDQHKTPVIQECMETNKKNLPLVLFLVAPMIKYDQRSGHAVRILQIYVSIYQAPS